MDVNSLPFAFVIVALGIGGVIVYLKGRQPRSFSSFWMVSPSRPSLHDSSCATAISPSPLAEKHTDRTSTTLTNYLRTLKPEVRGPDTDSSTIPRRLFIKAVQQGRSERKGEAYP